MIVDLYVSYLEPGHFWCTLCNGHLSSASCSSVGHVSEREKNSFIIIFTYKNWANLSDCQFLFFSLNSNFDGYIFWSLLKFYKSLAIFLQQFVEISWIKIHSNDLILMKSTTAKDLHSKYALAPLSPYVSLVFQEEGAKLGQKQLPWRRINWFKLISNLLFQLLGPLSGLFGLLVLGCNEPLGDSVLLLQVVLLPLPVSLLGQAPQVIPLTGLKRHKNVFHTTRQHINIVMKKTFADSLVPVRKEISQLQT